MKQFFKLEFLSSGHISKLQEKKIASQIYKGLIWAKNNFERFQSSEVLIIKLKKFYQKQKGLSIEYCEILNSNSFKPIKSLQEEVGITLCVAAYVEGVRLIDNIFLQE